VPGSVGVRLPGQAEVYLSGTTGYFVVTSLSLKKYGQ